MIQHFKGSRNQLSVILVHPTTPHPLTSAFGTPSLIDSDDPVQEVVLPGETGDFAKLFRRHIALLDIGETYVAAGWRNGSYRAQRRASLLLFVSDRIMPHWLPKAAAGQGFTAVRNCVQQWLFLTDRRRYIRGTKKASFRQEGPYSKNRYFFLRN